MKETAMQAKSAQGHRKRLVRKLYEFAQPAAPVAVREYILTTLDGQRCCLLHWILRESIALDCLSFSVVQLGENGEELETTEVTHSKEELPPAGEDRMFAPAWGIPVDDRCSAVRVQLHEVVSGPYVYRPTSSGVLVEYVTDTSWVYDKKALAKARLKPRIPMRVVSKLGWRTGGVWPIVFLALLVIAFVISYPYLIRIFPLESMIANAKSAVIQFGYMLRENVIKLILSILRLA